MVNRFYATGLIAGINKRHENVPMVNRFYVTGLIAGIITLFIMNEFCR